MAAGRCTNEAMDRLIADHYRYEADDDVAGVLATLAADVVHDVIGSPTGPLRGREQARSFYERLFADLEQHEVRSTHRYHGDGFAVDESVWRGIAVGDPLGLVGADRPLEFRMLHLFEFTEDGEIRRENVWMDTAAITAQLSLPAPSSSRAVVEAFYADFDRGSLDVSPTLDPSFEATVFGTTVLDRDGFVAFGRSFLDAFSDGRHEFDFVLADGDAVATIGHYRGHHDGVLMGVPPTGREVDFVVMHVDVVRAGRIVEHRGMGDVQAMWAQLGVAPPTVA